MAGYDITTILIHVAGFAIRNCLHQAIVGCLYQFEGALAYFADAVGLVHIGMETILVHADIQVYDVTFLKGTRVGYSMANALVYRGATTSRKLVIVQGRWISILAYNILVHNLINLFGGDSWSNYCMACVDGTPCYPTRFPYQFDVFSSVNWDLFVRQLLEACVGLACLRVVGFLYVIGNRAVSCERVRERPKRSRKFETRLQLFFSLFM